MLPVYMPAPLHPPMTREVTASVKANIDLLGNRLQYDENIMKKSQVVIVMMFLSNCDLFPSKSMYAISCH